MVRVARHASQCSFMILASMVADFSKFQGFFLCLRYKFSRKSQGIQNVVEDKGHKERTEWNYSVLTRICRSYLLICSLYNDAFQKLILYKVEWKGDKWMIKWKWFGRKRLLPNLRSPPEIVWRNWVKLRKTSVRIASLQSALVHNRLKLKHIASIQAYFGTGYIIVIHTERVDLFLRVKMKTYNLPV
jgi:hypothetical protein